MFSTFPSNYLGEQKNFFLFARNLINTMDMINTTPTESNLSGLNQKDFQKDINNKKTDLFILKNAQEWKLQLLITAVQYFPSWYPTKMANMPMLY